MSVVLYYFTKFYLTRLIIFFEFFEGTKCIKFACCLSFVSAASLSLNHTHTIPHTHAPTHIAWNVNGGANMPNLLLKCVHKTKNYFFKYLKKSSLHLIVFRCHILNLNIFLLNAQISQELVTICYSKLFQKHFFCVWKMQKGLTLRLCWSYIDSY